MPNNNKRIDKLKKVKTKESIEWIGLIELITIHADIIPPNPKIKKSKYSMLMSEGSWTLILSIRSRKLFQLSYRHFMLYRNFTISIQAVFIILNIVLG